MIPGIYLRTVMIPVMHRFFALTMFLVSCPSDAQETATAPAEQLYRDSCAQCHGLHTIEVTRDGRAGWADTVNKMVVEGAQLNSEETELVIDYLSRRFGPGAGAMKTGVLPPSSPMQTDGTVTSREIELPAGEGKELVQTYCQMCHDLGRVVSTRRSRDSWEQYAQNMLEQGGMELPPEKSRKLVSYLTQHIGR